MYGDLLLLTLPNVSNSRIAKTCRLSKNFDSTFLVEIRRE